ncbi:MAG: hypothetical protein SPL46_01365, partial [Selenomonadaceae bacterium]|nr:hypothetical protein [Selenomonadaceae bacterium]
IVQSLVDGIHTLVACGMSTLAVRHTVNHHQSLFLYGAHAKRGGMAANDSRPASFRARFRNR